MTSEVAIGSANVGDPLDFGVDQAVLSSSLHKLSAGGRAVNRTDSLLCASEAIGHAVKGKVADADSGEHGEWRISDDGMGGVNEQDSDALYGLFDGPDRHESE